MAMLKDHDDHIETLELNDEGSAICKFDNRTGEVLELYNWNGGNLGYRWEAIADEMVADLLFLRAQNSGSEGGAA